VNESQLIDGCIAQNRAAQRTLYERYSKAMYTSAYRITGDFGQAEEVLQDAFLQVFRHIADFQRKSTIGAWIKTIVLRTALKKVERRKEFYLELEESHTADCIDWGESPIDAEYLERAILSLPEGFRAVFVLAEVEGYTHKEIGEMLGISDGTSKSQLFCAKKRLREMLSLVF
jgi:RNA polymerase sigma factor (sigma-70 family)